MDKRGLDRGRIDAAPCHQSHDRGRDCRSARSKRSAGSVAAARAAQPAWGRLAPLARGRIMHRIAALIRDHAKPLARLVVQEQGKPIAQARGEIGGAAEFFTYFAEFARRIQGEILPSDIPGEHSWIQWVPVGVVVGIIPWHYPAALASRKVAPALIDGNTILLKPHEETPLSALYMARLMAEAGVPDGCREHRDGWRCHGRRCADIAFRRRPDHDDRIGSDRATDHAGSGWQSGAGFAGTGRQSPLHRDGGCRSGSGRRRCRHIALHELRTGLHLRRTHPGA
ncbi:MAG: aldehyde dehydrogenase family protein [Pseudorhodobacter sp.]|nr:aldehyde dehydrogenase family protein [Pseudorhodobacter sp.]